jgi:hypothetical protein
MRIAALLIALAAAAQTTTHVAPPLSGALGEPVQLFNGNDLSGWTWYQRPPKTATQPALVSIGDVWSVKDGVLHTKGKPTGYIRTDKDFPANYVLTVEFRHIAKGNGGILFALTGEDKIWPRCLEVQAANGEEGDIRNVADFKMTMDPSRVEPRRLRRIGPSSEKPAGEWETVQVIADSGNLTVTLNAVVQNVATNTEPLGGRIGLQSEGGEMEFRRIELTPIERREGGR